MMQRQPAVAGQFYSGNSNKLRSDLAGMIPGTRGTKKVTGIIAPHAGYSSCHDPLGPLVRTAVRANDGRKNRT